jgi:hypothetical protein
MADPKQLFKDDSQINELVCAFEACTFHPSQFRHYQHLAVALWYVSTFPYEEAMDRMKRGIRRLAETYGKTGYHETITIFWLKVVKNFLDNNHPAGSLADIANLLAAKYGNKTLINDYYSSEVLNSARAKAEWVGPDLQSLADDR